MANNGEMNKRKTTIDQLAAAKEVTIPWVPRRSIIVPECKWMTILKQWGEDLMSGSKRKIGLKNIIQEENEWL